LSKPAIKLHRQRNNFPRLR